MPSKKLTERRGRPFRLLHRVLGIKFDAESEELRDIEHLQSAGGIFIPAGTVYRVARPAHNWPPTKPVGQFCTIELVDSGELYNVSIVALKAHAKPVA